MNGTKHLSEKPLAILKFIWRWKVTTTAQVAHSFFRGQPIQTVYTCLSRMQKGGFIKKECDKAGRVYVWTLTKKGFAVVLPSLPKLFSEGFLSEHLVHDLIVEAVHLGPWDKPFPSNVEVFTEQELRNVDMELYPDWVPQSKMRRPDGYWRIASEGKTKTIAIEVELARKAPSDYLRVKKFYDLYQTVDRVLWLLTKRDQLKHIRETVMAGDPKNSRHDIVGLGQFVDKGWNAPIICGPDEGRVARNLVENNLQNTCTSIFSLPSLDARRFPIKPRTSRECFSALICD